MTRLVAGGGKASHPVQRWVALALLLGLALLPGVAGAQPEAGLYPASTMAAVLKLHAELLALAAAAPAEPTVDDTPDRYKLLVTYGGERRATGPEALAVIQRLGEELPAVPRAYLALFRQEIGVDADGKTYWMPARANLLPFVDTELHAGDPIYVYAVFIGAAGPRPVLLVDDFEKAQVQ